MKNADNTNFYTTMGYVYTNKVTPVIIADPSTFEQSELGYESIAILNEIIDICNENDISIIFYTTPYQGTYAHSDAMKKYAQENGCVYFNLFEYMDELGIDCETDFGDEGHLNNSGAVKVADFLGGIYSKSL